MMNELMMCCCDDNFSNKQTTTEKREKRREKGKVVVGLLGFWPSLLSSPSILPLEPCTSVVV